LSSAPHRHEHPIPDFNSQREFTFKELHNLNVTVSRLLSWSTSVDLVERYSFCIEQSLVDDPLSGDMFYKCTYPSFGPRCQYAFDVLDTDTVEQFIQDFYDSKDADTDGAMNRRTNP
jgi:hypothetical protein